jgi:hypothetical protein
VLLAAEPETGRDEREPPGDDVDPDGREEPALGLPLDGGRPPADDD